MKIFSFRTEEKMKCEVENFVLGFMNVIVALKKNFGTHSFTQIKHFPMKILLKPVLVVPTLGNISQVGRNGGRNKDLFLFNTRYL